MGTKSKLPGVYMIKNLINGKIYIGQSNDITQRWAKYRWAANSTANYKETKRPITLAIRKFGIDNFEFTILKTNAQMKDKFKRLAYEEEMIMKYNTTDPQYGYNRSDGFEYMLLSDKPPRKQKCAERIARGKGIFEYDIINNIATYYFSAKDWGKEHGFGKDVCSHTVKRGSIIDNRYYLIPANTTERKELLEKLRIKKTENHDQPLRARTHSFNAFEKYKTASLAVDQAALDLGF